MTSELIGSFQNSFNMVGYGVANTAPKIFLALLVFVLGWYVAAVLGKVVARGIGALKLDHLLAQTGLHEVLNRAGYGLNVGKFFGLVVKWFTIIVALFFFFFILGLEQVRTYLETVVNYIPNVVVAAIVLMITALVAEFVEKLVVGSAKAAEVRSSGFLGLIARWVIWVLGLVTALDQLQIGAVFTQFFFTLLTGLVAAISIALGVAFGLGGKDHAAKYLSKLDHEIGSRD